METCFIKSPLGPAKIVGDQNGISAISILEIGKVSTTIPLVLNDCATQLQEYFEGKRTDFDFKMNLVGSEFYLKVWDELKNIPFGKTISYLELASNLGNPKVVRAAAVANGKNPLWVAIPCHRVISKNGSLTGYAGGLWRKKWLLEFENPTIQHSLF